MQKVREGILPEAEVAMAGSPAEEADRTAEKEVTEALRNSYWVFAAMIAMRAVTGE
jgi:hypothetical protein